MQLSKEAVLMKANQACKNTLMETLNIEVVDFGADFLVARMPVDSRVYQPDGVLHGGATAALAKVWEVLHRIYLLIPKNFLCVVQR